MQDGFHCLLLVAFSVRAGAACPLEQSLMAPTGLSSNSVKGFHSFQGSSLSFQEDFVAQIVLSVQLAYTLSR